MSSKVFLIIFLLIISLITGAFYYKFSNRVKLNGSYTVINVKERYGLTTEQILILTDSTGKILEFPLSPNQNGVFEKGEYIRFKNGDCYKYGEIKYGPINH